MLEQLQEKLLVAVDFFFDVGYSTRIRSFISGDAVAVASN